MSPAGLLVPHFDYVANQRKLSLPISSPLWFLAFICSFRTPRLDGPCGLRLIKEISETSWDKWGRWMSKKWASDEAEKADWELKNVRSDEHEKTIMTNETVIGISEMILWEFWNSWTTLSHTKLFILSSAAHIRRSILNHLQYVLPAAHLALPSSCNIWHRCVASWTPQKHLQ